MVNAGVPLQARPRLGHHEPALRPTVRRHRPRRLRTRADPGQAHLGGPILPPADTSRLPIVGDWKDTPATNARMAGGYCIRTPAQGSCAYANICEHCPNYRSDPTFLPILATQKADAETLAADAQARGWIDEADRHLQLIERLDTLIGHTQAS
jgi:hypothetical protein